MINSTAVARKTGRSFPADPDRIRIAGTDFNTLDPGLKNSAPPSYPPAFVGTNHHSLPFSDIFPMVSHGFCHGSCHGFVGKAPMMACLAALPAATPSQAATSCSCNSHGQHLDTLRWRWWRWWPTSPRNGDFHKWWVPEYEWFLSWKNLLKWMTTRGTPISGNLQICDKSWKNGQKLGIWWHLQQNMGSITRYHQPKMGICDVIWRYDH